MSSDGDLQRLAARNNAEWCAAVCRSHGIASALGNRVWHSRGPSPQFYPDAVTVAPGVAASEVMAGIALEPGCSVKDSFADLELADEDFDVLFQARWIHRPAAPATSAPGDLATNVIDTPSGLQEWQSRWSGGDTADVFRPALLDDPAVRVLSMVHRDTAISGAVLNHAAGVLGVSNVFAAGAAEDPIGAVERVWVAAVAAATAWLPGTDLVGYEDPDDLPPALAAGFTPLGPLRVWLHHPELSEGE